ncbi:MAG: HD domain-containing protein [Defluviitaleaceae bacterium]|nr:HD domain-containing protein [Defluviitaleaceae bacterium]MCL2274966.1 HD domain-containing protein [Defluviitaleaceae bacterium]
MIIPYLTPHKQPNSTQLSENRLELLRNKIDTLIFEKQPQKIRFFIEHLYSVARYCALLAMKRNLSAELAMTAGMLHDIARITDNANQDHDTLGAQRTREILAEMGLYDEAEISTIATAVLHHCEKSTLHEPYDEILKDADVLSHCMYNPAFPISKWEVVRYNNLLDELGCGCTKQQ